MTEQLVIGPAPTFSNEEGARRAVAQIPMIAAQDWYVYYNRRQDIFYLRKHGHGPATSYSLPAQPDVFLRLDSDGVLVGIDLTAFRRRLTKERRELRFALRAWYIHLALAHIPGMRAVAEMLLRGLRARTRDEIQDFTAYPCPS
jgi:hypothetical protein